MAELSALADGTLPAERRGEVEARVAASPELRELLERQRQALLAAQTLTAEEVPGSLQVTSQSAAALTAGYWRRRETRSPEARA